MHRTPKLAASRAFVGHCGSSGDHLKAHWVPSVTLTGSGTFRSFKRNVSNGCLWRKPTSSAGSTDDAAEIDAHQLEYPAIKNAARLARMGAHIPSDQMTTAFSTNKSIQVISNASRRDL